MTRGAWVAMVLLLGGCGHDLPDGTYRFRQTQEIRSSCAVDSPLPLEWDGELSVRGLTITIELPVAGFRYAVAEKALVGVFQPDHRGDPRFLTDSTFDNVALVEGTSCLFFTHLQIEGTVRDDGHFDGVASIVDSRDLEADRACPFACVQRVEFEAKKR